MSEPDRTSAENRVLVLAPTGRDAANTKSILRQANIACALCRDIAELCRAIEAGTGAVLLTEEALSLDQASQLLEVLRKQPTWSDMPIVLLTRGGPESGAALRAMQTFGNVVLLERPVRISTLVTAVRTALRARARQYQIRDHMAQLQEADRRKDEFLAMLAHELRNPLAPVRNALQIMRMPNTPPELLSQAHEMSERQVGHMARLIDDLMEVSRISRGKIELQKARIDLNVVLRKVAEAMLAAVSSRKQELKLSLPAHPLQLHADAVRLEQVFVNLVTNAAKFTPAGGQIQVEAEYERDTIAVRVRDTGIGIGAALLPRIFELFVQAEQGSDRAQGGLGIGLTLVKTLVELHGGTVQASSKGPGCGSEFIVRLPRAADESADLGQAGAMPSVRPVPPKRILVVDDSQDAAESMALLLQLQGHEVRTAHSGAEAISASDTFRPEVVFLDIGLPGMDGYEIARRMRRQKDGSTVTLVALTGYGQDEDRRKSGEAGFNHHLVKPADPDTVARIVGEAS